jgi:hypothetical protein
MDFPLLDKFRYASGPPAASLSAPRSLWRRQVAVYLLAVLIVCPSSVRLSGQVQKSISLKAEISSALMELAPALVDRQMTNPSDPQFGALRCAFCGVYHTRAAEAIYPLAVAFKISNDTRYFRSALALGAWLIKQQQVNGSWKETPEEWTGTTTDQLLMMVLMYNQVQSKFTDAQRASWRTSIEKAADYLAAVMSPEFASINYCATTTASLAATAGLIPKALYTAKAKELARRTIAKMDRDGFIGAEGGKGRLNNKLGVDLGYDMEMSLWGLAYYARLTGDSLVTRHVRKSLANHLYFIYPDGSMDDSWGIRSNKWTTYGSATSDGCQVLFMLFADEDPRYVTAASKNLAYLKTNVKEGIVGYGPHYWDIFQREPCIYPTFTKAKNLALAYDLEIRETRPTAPLPTEQPSWLKRFPTLDVVEVRTENFMTTLTAYRYKDYGKRSDSKYMHRPTGGVISNLWLKDHGFLQASSQTIYARWEPMSFPDVKGLKSLTPRIEYEDSTGYFTNLYEFDAILENRQTGPSHFEVSSSGELRDKEWLNGAVGYTLHHAISDSVLQKSVTLHYRDASPRTTIVEPIIDYDGMTYRQIGKDSVLITAPRRRVLFSVSSGNVVLEIGRDRDRYRWPYPALKAFPIELHVVPPHDALEQTVVYKLTVVQ